MHRGHLAPESSFYHSAIARQRMGQRVACPGANPGLGSPACKLRNLSRPFYPWLFPDLHPMGGSGGSDVPQDVPLPPRLPGKLTPDTPPSESWPHILGPPSHLHSFFQSNSVYDPGPWEPFSITNQTCFLAKPGKPGNRNQTHPEAKYATPQIENRLLKFCPYGNSVQTPEGKGHHGKPTISFPQHSPKESKTEPIYHRKSVTRRPDNLGGFWTLIPGYLPLSFNTQPWNALLVLAQSLPCCISVFILNMPRGTICKNKQIESPLLFPDPYIVPTEQVILINISQSLSESRMKGKRPCAAYHY